jgi:hypothetical protein
MIRVTIELIPWGFGEPENIGTIEIANDGKGTADVGHYEARLLKSPKYAARPGVWRKAAIRGFPRLRLGPYDLLYRVLRAAVGDRNPDGHARSIPVTEAEAADDATPEA